MKSFIEKLINAVYYGLIILTLSATVCYGILYVGSIKNEIDQVSNQVAEVYDALAFQYSETMKVYAVNTYLVLGLTKNLEEAKAQAIKDKNELAQEVLGVDTAAKNRDAAILTAVARELHRPEYAELKSHTVMIISQDKLNPDKGSMGTGVVIKVTDESTFIVTNNHVCEETDMNRCYVFDPETKIEYDISLVKKHTTHDVQIVRVSGKIDGKVPVKGIKDVTYQDKVYLVGHYLGNSFFYSEGVVAGFDRETGDLVTAAPAGPSNSGSGIITQDGYLTGLLYAGKIVGQFPFMTFDLTHSLCVNSEVLRLFLAGYIE